MSCIAPSEVLEGRTGNPSIAVTEDMLKPEDVAVLDKDDTMHSYNVFYRNAFYDVLLQAVTERRTWRGEV